MKKEETLIGVQIPEIKLQTMILCVEGDSPLIVHAWSEKAKKMILDKQMKKVTGAKEAKDPWMDYCESMYWLDGMPEEPTEEDIEKARFGFPACAFKAAAVDAGYQQGILAKKTTARGAFHIIGVANYGENLSQNDKDDMMQALDRKTNDMIERLEKDLEEQNKMLKEILDIMKGE